MNEIKRLIDLNTLRKNPNAGSRDFYVVGETYTTENPDGTITTLCGHQHIRTLYPQSDWLFEREALQITCSYCKASFPIEKLEEDWYDYDWNVSNICPKCKKANCFNDDIIYETIEEALKRKEGKC
jgi:hypothetical protein